MTRAPRGKSPPPYGWFWIENTAVEMIGDVGPLAFTVYAVLAKHADANRCCYPAVPRIARLLKRSDRAIQKAIHRLREAGLIAMRRSKGGRGKDATNRYELLPLPPPSKGEPSFTAKGESNSTTPPHQRVNPGSPVNPTSPPGVNSGSPEQDSVEQDPKRKKPRASKDGQGYSPEFLAFYQVYPRKVAKEKAAKAYLKAVETIQQEHDCESASAQSRLLEAATAYSQSDQARGPRKYIPYPATWLNQARYDDDRQEWSEGGGDAASLEAQKPRYV